ncbi:MAG: amidase [Bradymonadales bacterium]|nr:amidase [Bradymonadales bacterium]
MDPLLTLSATALARMIRTGEIRSTEVVRAHIERIQQVNPSLNAMVCDRFEAARKEAEEADRQVRAGKQLPAFHGVPCTIKESFRLTGMPNTSGLVSRVGTFADRDAVTVRRLRQAGAIPLGVSNVSELCMWMESDNRVYGRTNNPYDPTRIVGGSSGGEAALVGAGCSPFGLAADVGGSTRMPAFFCGVFGHKPTGGLVPNRGQFPEGANEASRYLATGPICRRAEDLMPLLRVLAGPDPEDDRPLPWRLGDPDSVDPRALRVYLVPDNGLLPVARSLQEAQRRAADALATRGAQIEEIRIEGLRDSLLIWSSMMSLAGGPTFKEHMGGGTPIKAGRELLRWLAGRSDHTFPAIGLGLVESAESLFPGRSASWMRHGQALRRKLTQLLGNDGLLLYPPYPEPAPKHNRPLLPPIQWIYTAIFNAMEMPATQVPLGLDDRGLPLGVQVVASHGYDHLTIAAAQWLEEDLGGWVFPPALDR